MLLCLAVEPSSDFLPRKKPENNWMLQHYKWKMANGNTREFETCPSDVIHLMAAYFALDS